MKIDPFHLISTPVPVLPTLGLRTEVGLSGEDPSVHRHRGLGFSAWLTVYSPDGQRVRRTKIGELKAGERKWYDVSALTSDLSYDRPYLCVVHRVPEDLVVTAETAQVEVADGRDLDFDMYRSVLQLSKPGAGKGSVIYETPPHFNANPSRAGSFLCFSNQVFLAPGADTYLVFLHYSIHPKYAATARRRLLVHAQDGRLAAENTARVAPFTVDVVSCASLLGEAKEARQFSFVACSDQASMIPLIVNLSEKRGGVSVEHTHPPISYLNMPMELAVKVRQRAIKHYLEQPAVPA